MRCINQVLQFVYVVPVTPKQARLLRLVKKHRQQAQIIRYRLYSSKPKGRVTKQRCIKMVSKYLSGPSHKLVSTQIQMTGHSTCGCRWSAGDKALALSLFHASPKCYSLLRIIFALPTTRTLCQALSNTNIYPGFSTSFIHIFHQKVDSLGPNERKCAVIFNEMNLKRAISYNSEMDYVEGVEDLGTTLGRTKYVASSALAFTVTGLKSKWKQLGYFIISGVVKVDVLKQLVCHAVDVTVNVGL